MQRNTKLLQISKHAILNALYRICGEVRNARLCAFKLNVNSFARYIYIYIYIYIYSKVKKINKV